MTDLPAATKRFHVTVLEWLSHTAVIEAATPEEAEQKARDLWDEGNETEDFQFRDSGLDGVDVEEV